MRNWRLLLAAVCAVLTLIAASTVHARGPAPLGDVALAELPAEARATYERVLAGGPFRYDRDGVVFGNRERLLPEQPHGYYHEYTVPTPGARNRGAQRIVCGGPKTAPHACFYTGDHYRSFRRIRS